MSIQCWYKPIPTRIIFFFYFFKGAVFTECYMMSEPPGSKDGDEICPICNREKRKHIPEEMLACSRKMQESNKDVKG